MNKKQAMTTIQFRTTECGILADEALRNFRIWEESAECQTVFNDPVLGVRGESGSHFGLLV